MAIYTQKPPADRPSPAQLIDNSLDSLLTYLYDDALYLPTSAGLLVPQHILLLIAGPNRDRSSLGRSKQSGVYGKSHCPTCVLPQDD